MTLQFRRAVLAALTAATLLSAPRAALAQLIGGTEDISVLSGAASTAVALPASVVNFPAVVLTPASGSTIDIRTAYGASTVLATATSPPLPPGGICFYFGAANSVKNYISTWGVGGTATLHVTQYSQCPQGIGFSGGSSGGGGGGSVTQGTTPWVVTATSWGSTPANLGAPSAMGTAPSGNVIGTNSDLFVAGLANAVGNPAFVSPGTGAVFSTSDNGTAITGQTLSAGGAGVTGWLSQINASINSALGVNVSATLTSVTGHTVGGNTGVDINTNSVNNVAILTGAGATGTGSPRTTVAQDATTIAGAPPGRTYNTVAASQTAQALTGGGGGATGDYLSHCVITPGTTSPGTAIILDNATAIYTFAGGASSVTTLISWPVPVGAVSTSGAWKITTGANVTVFCSGKFT